jgi:hypothetical protein
MSAGDVFYPGWDSKKRGRWVRGPNVVPDAQPNPVETWSDVRGKKMNADASVKANKLRGS